MNPTARCRQQRLKAPLKLSLKTLLKPLLKPPIKQPLTLLLPLVMVTVSGYFAPLAQAAEQPRSAKTESPLALSDVLPDFAETEPTERVQPVRPTAPVTYVATTASLIAAAPNPALVAGVAIAGIGLGLLGHKRSGLT